MANGRRATPALRHLKHSLDDVIVILRNCLNGRHVDPELSFPRTAISLAMLRDINMLLRKDSLMKVDKDCKNMSRASRRLQGWRTRSTQYGADAAIRLLFVHIRATYARTYIQPHIPHIQTEALVTIVHVAGSGRGQNSADAICINEAPDNGARSMNYVPMFEPNEGT